MHLKLEILPARTKALPLRIQAAFVYPALEHRKLLIAPDRTSLLPLAMQADVDLNVPKDWVLRARYWGLSERAIGTELTIAAIATIAEMAIRCRRIFISISPVIAEMTALLGIEVDFSSISNSITLPIQC